MKPPIWFRAFLALVPRDFRRRHGDEITHLASRYAEGRSLAGRTAVWARASLDVLSVAIRARATLPDQLTRDARTGIRSLRRDLGFTAFAILMIGFGIGASVAVFSVARALLLRPLPFSEPERLVWISNGEFGRGQALSTISVQSGQLEPLRTVATQFTDVGGYHLFDREGDHTIRFGDVSLRATRLRVTGNFFGLLGVQPIEGRLFADEEVIDDGPPVVLLTHAGWRRLFDGAGGAVGSEIDLDGDRATVIGILPPSFGFTEIFAPGSRIDYVAPFPLTERSNRTGNTLGLIGRLAPGASIASAQAEAEALTRSDLSNEFEPVVRPLRDHLSGGLRPTVGLLAASVLMVMLMVCANLSNLLLARGAARERELSVRAAIGADRGRLIRQLLTESLLLSGAGAVLGVGLAVAGTRLLASLDLRIPMLAQTRVDGTTLRLTLVAAVGTGLLFGVAPALRGSAHAPGAALGSGARGASDNRQRVGFRRTLVAAQVAIACLLLVASTLTARSLLHLVDTDLGYDPEGRVAVRIDPTARFESDAERIAYYTAVLDRARSTPEVEAAGLSDLLPMAFNRRWDFRVVGRDEDPRYPFMRIVSDDYAAAMGLEVVRGRDFTPADGPDSRPVALVNELLAERAWPGESPLGAIINTSGHEYEVVGVVRSTRQLSVDQEPGIELFLPMWQNGDQSAVHLIVRGDRPPADLTALARSAVRGVSADVPLDQVVSLDAVVGSSLATQRFLASLLGGFAAFALLLAALGVYAVVSYSVSQRRREIGIRIALGATNERVVGRLLRDGVAMTAVGLGVGLLLALAGAGSMQSLLYGVEATDPLNLAAVIAALSGVAVAASWIPARRALAIDPAEAVKSE